jgi:hypothetical protein
MVGVCWSFALSTMMENAVRRAGGRDVVAPLHVLAADTWNQLWSKGRGDRDLALESSWRYEAPKACKLSESGSEVWCGEAYSVVPGSWRSDPNLVAEAARANTSGVYRISRVETLSARSGSSDQIARVLATGQSVFMNIAIDRNAWASIAGQDSTISDYATANAYHAVVLVGYRPANGGRQFLVHNSWGPSWRDGGYAWVSDQTIQRHARDLFTLEISARTSTKPIEPTPASAECPAGEAPDLLLHWCTPRCPDGAPTTAMLCRGAAMPPLFGRPWLSNVPQPKTNKEKS